MVAAIGKCKGLVLASFGALVACSLSQAPATSGGVALDAGAATEGGGATACASALLVASTDYTSTNISVLSPEGAPLSASILSSGSTPPGLTTALSGDVAFPLERTPGKIVLIDRYPNSVLTWVDPATAAVLHQLAVGTGFGANPHDYLEVSPTKAYVTRYESNMKAGLQANDGGGDLLIVDPQAAAITGRVPFAADGAFLPRPDHMVRVGNEVWVSLGRLDADFMTAGDGQLVGVSTADDSIAWTLDLPGVASCGAMAIAPAGSAIALNCSGNPNDADPKQRSAIVLLDATAHPPVEIKRFAVAAQLGAPIAPSLVAYASDNLLVGVTLGDMKAARNDVAFTLDLTSGTAQALVDAGAAFALGDVHCAPGCGDLCFLADAHANALRVWKANGSTLDPQPQVAVDPSVGLPPRALGAF